jgi:hypothetical protein
MRSRAFFDEIGIMYGEIGIRQAGQVSFGWLGN